MSLFKKILITFVAATAMAAGSASATVLTAVGSGWCNNNSSCNSSANTIRNTASGYSDSYRNFLNFDLATIAGNVGGATLSIWNDINNNSTSAATTYVVHAATGISFAGLGNGVVLGSVNTMAANAGGSHYVDIVLNQAAVTALQAARGQQFLFGGVNTDSGLMFGSTSGEPRAYLTVTNAVPEPASLGLLGLAFAGLLAARRRKA